MNGAWLRMLVVGSLVSSLVGILVGSRAEALPFDPNALTAEVRKMMESWNQPGLAIALVDGGKIVYERGFGVRNLSTGTPVDPQTLFGIGSCSKSFASATVAKLVMQQRLDWDDLVVKHMPWFRMPRDRDTDEVTVRDLLSMRTGIGSSEYTFRRVSANRADHVRRIRFLPQMHPLRSEYLYTTDTYTAAGEVVAELTGRPWEEFAAATLWGPLGMTRTNADHLIARSDPNSASPHLTISGRAVPIPWVYEDYNAAPAGGVNSTAHDLAQWLLFELNRGALGGNRLLSATALAETQRAQTPQRGRFAQSDWADAAGTGPDRLSSQSYAMGWFLHDYRGTHVVWHAGAIDGFRCQMGFLPDRGFGIVVLSNADELLLPIAVFQTAVDYDLGLGGRREWSGRLLAKAREKHAQQEARERELAAARLPNTHPSLPPESYTGVFADNGAFGECRVSAIEGHIAMSCGRMIYDLEHWHLDVFKARPRWPYEMETRNFFVTFHVDEHARVASLRFSTGADFARLSEIQAH